MLKLHELHLILLTICGCGQVQAYRAFGGGSTVPPTLGKHTKAGATFACYCKKVDSKEDCYGPEDWYYHVVSKRSKRFYRQDGMCCKVKINVDVLESMKHKFSGYKKVEMEMCQETYEVPAASCCYVDVGKHETFGLHIKKAISYPTDEYDDKNLGWRDKTLPAFDLDDITGGGEADQPWSADDVRYLLTSRMSDTNPQLHCNKDMHEVIEDRDCKLFESRRNIHVSSYI